MKVNWNQFSRCFESATFTIISLFVLCLVPFSIKLTPKVLNQILGDPFGTKLTSSSLCLQISIKRDTGLLKSPPLSLI